MALVAAGGLGIVVGRVTSDWRPRVALAQAAPQQAPVDGKLRIIVFGAHPDSL